MSCRLSPLLVFAAVLVTTGCRPAPVYYLVEGEPKALTVRQPPPAPRLEDPSPAPGPDYAWRDGYWGLGGDDGNYGWNPGEWVQPPNPGYVFVPPTYGLVDGIWYYRPSFWCQRGHRDRFWRRHHGIWRSAGAHYPKRWVGYRPYPGPGAGGVNSGRVRAPAVGGVVGGSHSVHAKAPPARGIEQQDHRTTSSHTDPSSIKSAAGWRNTQRPRGTVVLDRTPVGSPRAIDIHRPSRGAAGDRSLRTLRAHPSYRGTQGGRPSFGDNLHAGGYRRDATGAIVLTERGPRLASQGRRGPRLASQGRRGPRGLVRAGSTDRVRPNVRAAHDPRVVRGPQTGGFPMDQRSNRYVRPPVRTYYPSRHYARPDTARPDTMRSYGPRHSPRYAPSQGHTQPRSYYAPRQAYAQPRSYYAPRQAYAQPRSYAPRYGTPVRRSVGTAGYATPSPSAPRVQSRGSSGGGHVSRGHVSRGGGGGGGRRR